MHRLLWIVMLLVACGPAQPMNGPSMNNKMNPTGAPSRVVSTDILEREAAANRTRVKHILISWRELAGSFAGGQDQRGAARSKADAEAEVERLLAAIDNGADFDALMMSNSEDTGRTTYPDGYVVTPDATLVLEFRRLGLRLELDEIGVIESEFGFHVMKRVE